MGSFLIVKIRFVRSMHKDYEEMMDSTGKPVCNSLFLSRQRDFSSYILVLIPITLSDSCDV